MIKITGDYINSIAPNESAVKNAQGLVKKKSFVKLSKSQDDTLIFGECTGSGAENYICSVDFIKPESPVFRCTCPSRQIPCKHALGLMYAYIGGDKFEASEIPEDIREKRVKIEKRETRKNEGPGDESPRKVNKSALAKKIKAQLQGIDLLEKITKDITKWGFAAIDKKTLDMLEEQAKGLSSSYLPGAQRALREFILLFKNNENREFIYTEALNHISSLYSLCKRGRDYLNKRLNDPELSMDASSSIDEWLGHAWQIGELETAGLYEDDPELIQLYFNSYTDEARLEYVDLGLWVDLKSGAIHETCNYRPFRAAKYIHEDDSFFSAANVLRLYTYPGDMNKRVRWEEANIRDIRNGDYIKIKSLSKRSYAEVIKGVKNQMKNPLSDKNPAALLYYKRLGTIDGDFVIEDESGKRIRLVDSANETPSIPMLRLLKQGHLENQAVLVRFVHDMDSGRLAAQPLSVVTDNEIIRLIY